MKMVAVNLLLLCTAVLAQQASKKETPSEQRVGLIELEASTHIEEGPIREGRYDDSFQIKRARYYDPDLMDCSDRIANVAKQWADNQGATIIKSERGARRVLVHLLKPKAPGYYELRYRVDLAKGTAQVTFFQVLEGRLITPADPQSGIATLVPMLKEALTCVEPSSSSSH